VAEPGALAPINPPASNAWLNGYLRPLFRRSYVDTLEEVRGVGSADDLDTDLTQGRRYAEQRDAVAGNVYYQGRRGEMAPIPTPQELIKKVTGVGVTVRGR
jgi:hypothetical protein